jgi:hypothetical protein
MEIYDETGTANHSRHPSWLPEDMRYLKEPFLGPTDSMLAIGPAAVRNSPNEEQQPTPETSMTNNNTGTTKGNSIPIGRGVDSDTIIMTGTSSPTPGPENIETV